MSATTTEVGQAGLSSSRVRGASVSAVPLPLRAFLASRALVLLAGVAGSLAVPRGEGWSVFDPAGLTMRLGALGNVLAGSAVRWDSIHYLAIARHGYTAKDSVFFPLYPLLARLGAFILGSDVIAGVAISAASFAAALLLLHRLTELELGGAAAGAAVLLVAFAPLSFFFTAIYTEALFLALSVGSVLAARRERWALACCLGALATLTRVTGILLAVPIAIFCVQARRRLDRQLGWVLLLPGALGAYLLFLAVGGISPLAPFQQEAAWARHTTGPIGGLLWAVQAAARGAAGIFGGHWPVVGFTVGGPLTPGGESILLLLVLGFAAAALVCCFRRLGVAYAAYSAIALLVSISSPVAAQPLVSLDRYALTIFPLWMAAAAWIAERRLTRAAVLLGAALLVFYALAFASWSFVA